jgi:hypothetical protein
VMVVTGCLVVTVVATSTATSERETVADAANFAHRS